VQLCAYKRLNFVGCKWLFAGFWPTAGLRESHEKGCTKILVTRSAIAGIWGMRALVGVKDMRFCALAQPLPHFPGVRPVFLARREMGVSNEKPLEFKRVLAEVATELLLAALFSIR